VAFSPKSNLLVTGSFDESAVVWDVRRGKVLRVLPAHSDAVWTVGWDAEGGMVLTGSADGLIRLWDANTGQCLKTLDNDDHAPVSFAAFTPSSFFLLSSTLSSTLRVYNMYTSKVLKTLRAPLVFVSEKHPCPAIAYPALPVADAGPNGLPSGAALTNGDAMEVDGPAPNGTLGARERQNKTVWIVTGSENGKAVLFDLGTKEVIQVLEVEGVSSPVVAIAVSPDGRTIATGSLEPDKTIRIWRDAV